METNKKGYLLTTNSDYKCSNEMGIIKHHIYSILNIFEVNNG